MPEPSTAILMSTHRPILTANLTHALMVKDCAQGKFNPLDVEKYPEQAKLLVDDAFASMKHFSSGSPALFLMHSCRAIAELICQLTGGKRPMMFVQLEKVNLDGPHSKVVFVAVDQVAEFSVGPSWEDTFRPDGQVHDTTEIVFSNGQIRHYKISCDAFVELVQRTMGLVAADITPGVQDDSTPENPQPGC